ncbi:Malate/L-lactate dehydrogenase [Methanocaldococcus infernus ME]|uniref:Malate/L-lactate dehydrogenase n=1 Tax=Methanocaldococcus infernus (strain DSM 11812 / JCM 15783 / ME) TaxID=573063 RepID=D5VQJ4_METIM|nr:L-sulfolactate dehydrogenase [Methanocaldococcus infernus]ADG12847.1 Malate/L-lactate dehydrogenase [Methanocaldococcus infernus ME]
MKIKPEMEKELIVDILKKYSLPEEDAKVVANCIVEADLKGFTSHGLGRFPQYIKALELGNLNPKPNIKVVKDLKATAIIDGDLGFGQVVGKKAMELAIKKAEEFGISAVSTRNSGHFGIASFYSEMALERDLIGIVITNTEPAMAPYGGKTKILGTNPIAIAFKGNKYKFSLDMATSSIARGKILEALRKGMKIPEGCAINKEGKITTDPKEALEGSILPFGGPKGYGLALAIEVLAAIGGGEVGSDVKGTANPKEKCNKGDLFIVINPDFFIGKEEFKKKVDKVLEEIKRDNALIPGEIEENNKKKRLKEGIEVDENLYKMLKDICDKVGLDINTYFERE